MNKFIFPQGQYARPKEEQEVYHEVKGNTQFINPWDSEPEIQRRMLARYSQEELEKIYANVQYGYSK